MLAVAVLSIFGKQGVGWLAVASLWLGAAACSAGGQITYPAPGNIDFGQGTIEMWLTPQFDPDERISGSY